MPKLPRAGGEKHIAAFVRAGWIVNHIEGSHHILIKKTAPSIFQSLFIPEKSLVLAFFAN